jgi:uncharacterized protein (TIGR03118 family)
MRKSILSGAPNNLMRVCFWGGLAAAAVGGAIVACTGSGETSGPDASVLPDAGVVGRTDAGVALVAVNSTLLVANSADAGAEQVDPDLVNAWGLAFGPTGVAWISDNGTGQATLVPPRLDGGALAGIVVPPPPKAKLADATATSSPTGMVLNTVSTAFKGDVFLVATEDGTIAGWQPSNPGSFVIRVDQSAADGAGAAAAVYKGLAILPSTPPVLLAANFHQGTIDVFDSNFTPVVSSDGGTPKTVSDAGSVGTAAAAVGVSAWTDSTLPTGYAPFNVAVLGQSVYVAYALQDSAKHDDTPGAGLGAVTVFDLQGNRLKSLLPVTTGGALNAPWAMAIAPSGWGVLSGDLLVGNFGAGTVNAFDPTTGAHTAQLATPAAQPLVIDGLWALAFGNNADTGVPSSKLFFTAGPDEETAGHFGVLTLAP